SLPCVWLHYAVRLNLGVRPCVPHCWGRGFGDLSCPALPPLWALRTRVNGIGISACRSSASDTRSFGGSTIILSRLRAGSGEGSSPRELQVSAPLSHAQPSLVQVL